MAEYFGTREDAEKFMNEWYAKDNELPVFFGKVFNHNEEKWIVNYDARQDPTASPYIQVLEDNSDQIRKIVTTPWPQRQNDLEQERAREEQQKREQQEREERRKREQEYLASVKERRKADGVCVMCGTGLGAFDKLFGKAQHGRCKQFRG